MRPLYKGDFGKANRVTVRTGLALPYGMWVQPKSRGREMFESGAKFV